MQLSHQEEKILNLAVEGFKPCLIAEKLGLSKRTVHNHLNHIYAKNNVHSLLEAVVLFLKTSTY